MDNRKEFLTETRRLWDQYNKLAEEDRALAKEVAKIQRESAYDLKIHILHS
jgi:hypothetical protein